MNLFFVELRYLLVGLGSVLEYQDWIGDIFIRDAKLKKQVHLVSITKRIGACTLVKNSFDCVAKEDILKDVSLFHEFYCFHNV